MFTAWYPPCCSHVSSLPGPHPDSGVTGLNKDGEYLEQRMQSGVIYIDFFSKATKKRGERRNYSVFHFRDLKKLYLARTRLSKTIKQNLTAKLP